MKYLEKIKVFKCNSGVSMQQIKKHGFKKNGRIS